MLTDLTRRVGVVLGATVTLLTGIAVGVSQAVVEVTPHLPDGWQDNAVQIGASVVVVLGAATVAVRRIASALGVQLGEQLPPAEDWRPRST